MYYKLRKKGVVLLISPVTKIYLTQIMKNTLILLLFAGIICACENSDSPKPDSFIVLGESAATIVTVDSVIVPSSRCKNASYNIDLDADGENDFSLNVYYCFSPSYYGAELSFECLNNKAKVLTNDSILSPEILLKGDTLDIDKNWISGKMEIIRVNMVTQIAGGDGIMNIHGNWYDLRNKYMGLLIENEANPIYGWIRLSVPEDYWVKTIEIHEIAFQKAVYPVQ